MKTNTTLSAAILLAAIAAAPVLGQAPFTTPPAAGLTPQPLGLPPAPAAGEPAASPAAAPELPGRSPSTTEPATPGVPPPAADPTAPPADLPGLPGTSPARTPGGLPSSAAAAGGPPQPSPAPDNVPAPRANPRSRPGKPKPVPAPPVGVPGAPGDGKYFERPVGPGGGFPAAPPAIVAPPRADSGFGSGYATPPMAPGANNLSADARHGNRFYEKPVPVEQPSAARAEQVIREAKFKVFQRHYETALTEMMDIEKALLDAPAEKRDALAAKAKALREFSDKLENDIRELGESPQPTGADGKPGMNPYGRSAIPASARAPEPVVESATLEGSPDGAPPTGTIRLQKR